MWWKYCFVAIQIQLNLSVTIFAHGMIAVVGCAQFCSDVISRHDIKFPLNLTCDGKGVSEMSRWTKFPLNIIIWDLAVNPNQHWKCCRIWSWSPMLCEKHGPRDSVDKNRGRRPRFLSLLRPEGHVFHTAWETMIKCYYSTLADWFFSMFYSHRYEF